MKISIGRDVLLDGLQKVFSIVPQKPTLPVLTNFLLKAEGNTISVYGTDMDISINTSMPCVVDEDGAVMVNAKRLINMARELPEGDVEITVKDEQFTINIEKGKSSIMGMPASDYPELRDNVDGTRLKLSGREFVEMVDKTAFAVAVERTRIALTGVYWKYSPSESIMVATDGHRLALFGKKQANPEVTEDSGSDETAVDMTTATVEVIIPHKALSQASRIVTGGEDLQSVVFGEKLIQFTFANTILISKLVEGPYPNFRQVIPRENSRLVTLSTAELEAAVRRVSVLSNAITHQIRLSIGSGTVEISTTNMDIGAESQETLPIQYDGESMMIGFNASFFLEIIRKIESDEVLLELETPTSASILKPVGIDESEELLYLIMPLRLND